MSATPRSDQDSPHTIAVDDVPAHRPLAVALDLEPEEIAQLAEDIGAVAIGKFRFEGEIALGTGSEVRLTATLGASVTQSCVVTLNPVRTRIDEKVRRRFAAIDAPTTAEYHLREDEDVEIDPLTGRIDLLEIAREALILALPAYPRAEGAALAAQSAAPPGTQPLTDEAMRPFAALAALKSKLPDAE